MAAATAAAIAAATSPSPLRPGSYLGEISALSFLPVSATLSPLPLLLAGTGSQLLIYDLSSAALLHSSFAFHGVRVHGITVHSADPNPTSFTVSVFGERRVKLLQVTVHPGLRIELDLLQRLPGFDHWVLDVCFLKEDDVVAVGLSDNSVVLWDSGAGNVVQRVRSEEKTLLYSMRMWGNSLEELKVASGTIYNEILIWKLCPTTILSSSMELYEPGISTQHQGVPFHAINMNKLTGHEGSIFRLTWSSDGTKVVSVSDDRSARIWLVGGHRSNLNDYGENVVHDISANITLFGHNARIWDCCIFDSIVITAGEDCTCRVWGKEGSELMMVKEHIGRGIWRCLFDPNSSLLITGGFDSAIKVRQLCFIHGEPTERKTVLNDTHDQKELFSIPAPKVSQLPGLMDSKSEYIRCLRFMRENILYVATNNGFLHRVELSNPADVRWTELVRVSQEAPIVCMDLLRSSEVSFDAEDMVATGDGKGNVTITKVSNKAPTHKMALSFTWSAEKERQLLGIFWCGALGPGHIFTTDPRGVLKLWKIHYLSSGVESEHWDLEVSHIAVFRSCFGARIMCLDVSVKEEILICGDQRGNLTIFSLSECLIDGYSSKTVEEIPSTHFKGAHGISSITSISFSSSCFDQFEIRTTGGDGCICFFKYDINLQRLEFTGMKKLKDLSTVQSIFANSTTGKFSGHGNYAIGFTSTDFIVWDLVNEMKMLQIPCGGWRRSYSYHLGPVPEYQSCFAYLKDDIIHIRRLWVPANERTPIPQTVHMQCHGREIHSLCIISSVLHSDQTGGYLWTATGCEDGTVRLTRYMPTALESCESKLLGEHVGGSAVRSVYFASKIYTIGAVENGSVGSRLSGSSLDRIDSQFLLISVGAKQVLTSWVLQCVATEPKEISSISFHWLSTHMPPKFASSRRTVNKLEITESIHDAVIKSAPTSESGSSECNKPKPLSVLMDQNENDWRYLAVTAFLVRHVDSRITVCFVVVSSSDATLTLRALLLPYRLWFDVALLVPQTAPVIALQNLIIPGCDHSHQDSSQVENTYIIISGSTDGSITFWDLTDTVEDAMKQVSELQPEMLIDCQRRPQTGRGSQGGRWWRTLRHQSSDEGVRESVSRIKSDNSTNSNNNAKVTPGASSTQGSNNSQNLSSINSHILRQHSSVKHEVRPLHILNSVHKSGVNCLHVSRHSESKSVHCLVSGGDDQAVHCLGFDLVVQLSNPEAPGQLDDIIKSVQDETPSHSLGTCARRNRSHKFRVLFQDTMYSAHSSSVKGIWTDGIWAFSTGLDQRVRCWKVGCSGKLTEEAHLIISVPEPEALDAVFVGRYQIAVAGRGMQMIEFSPS